MLCVVSECRLSTLNATIKYISEEKQKINWIVVVMAVEKDTMRFWEKTLSFFSFEKCIKNPEYFFTPKKAYKCIFLNIFFYHYRKMSTFGMYTLFIALYNFFEHQILIIFFHLTHENIDQKWIIFCGYIDFF